MRRTDRRIRLKTDKDGVKKARRGGRVGEWTERRWFGQRPPDRATARPMLPSRLRSLATGLGYAGIARISPVPVNLKANELLTKSHFIAGTAWLVWFFLLGAGMKFPLGGET